MAYGKGPNRDALKRMVDLGRSSNTPEVSSIRTLFLHACSEFADAIWPTSVLDDVPSGKPLDAVMLQVQSGMKGKLNSVWAEKARLTAKASVTEQLKRARGNLFGRFKHLSTQGDKPDASGVHRLLNFPAQWSGVLTKSDVEHMQALSASMDFAGTMDLFRKLEAETQVSGLTDVQADALRGMMGLVKARYRRPEWKFDDSVVQLHLDFRCMPGGRKAQDALFAGLDEAARAAGLSDKPVSTVFLVSGPVAHSKPLKVCATVRADVVARLADSLPDDADPRFTSVALEIGPTHTTVKAVFSLQPKPFELFEARHLLGVDFGLVNTAAAALVEVDTPLDAEWLALTQDWTKKQCKAYLEGHSHGGDAAQTLLLKGRNFLARIGVHAKHVDALRSEIDRNYNRLGRLRHEANRILGQPSETRLDLDKPTNDGRLSDLLGRFGRLLGVIVRLKLLRRQVYRSVDGLKWSWFGWVSTQLARLCSKEKAAYVREDLTILATEKKSSGYLGRTFNKMMNNGSKGQFLRRITDKLKWYGVPEIVVPSFHTSSTDVRHSVVDKSQRRGEVFRSKVDGRCMHADLHAGLTIALWPMLRPNGQIQAAL